MFESRDLSCRSGETPGQTPEDVDFELSMRVSAGEGGLRCVLRFNAELFETERIRRMLEHYQILLSAMTTDPDLLASNAPMLSEAERRRLLVEWNDTSAEYPSVCVHQLLEAQVKRNPHAVAIIHNSRQVTYGELNRAANAVARHLRSLGIGPDAMVGICAERSVEMIVCLLAVLKAGGCYVPLDPGLPSERLKFILQDMQPLALLCSRKTMPMFQKAPATLLAIEELEEITALQRKDDPHYPVNPEHLAYMLYTSGSTGQPKGVLVSHDALVNYLCWCATAYPFEPGCGSPLHTSIGFDLTVTSLFPPLLAGTSVTLAAEDLGTNGLASLLRSQEFGLVKLTPSHLEGLRDALSLNEVGIRTRAFVIGGEALFGEALSFYRKQNPAIKLINEYGPTEATVGCCVYDVPPGDPPSGAIPIGRPISNVTLYALDRNLQPAPIGVPGELYIGGRGLARGYHRRPELTAERFIADPFSETPGARLYKTGDLVRYRPDGNLQFLGRLDNQVKVRGFRIELHEIEAALLEHVGVRDVSVSACGSSANRRLAAYIATDSTPAPLEADLRSFLKRKLPAYMLPSSYVFMRSLPMTTNGKVDRAALELLETKQEASSEADHAARDAVESRLLAIWEDILQISPIGRHDDFFDLGGQSLAAARLMARIAKEFNQTLTLSALFEAPTVDQLADVVKGRKRRVDPRISPIQPHGSLPPFFCVGAGPLFRALTHHLGPEQPFLGLDVADYHALPSPFRLEDLAAYFVSAVLEAYPAGPYFLGGWSDSGIVAYEVAQQLRRKGAHVGLLALFDSENEAFENTLSLRHPLRARADYLGQWLRINWGLLRNSGRTQAVQRVRAGLAFRRQWLKERFWSIRHPAHKTPSTSPDTERQNDEFLLRRAVIEYRPQPYDGNVVLFQRSARPKGMFYDAQYGWGGLSSQLGIVEIPGDHRDVFLEPGVRILAAKLGASLADSRELSAAAGARLES